MLFYNLGKFSDAELEEKKSEEISIVMINTFSPWDSPINFSIFGNGTTIIKSPEQSYLDLLGGERPEEKQQKFNISQNQVDSLVNDFYSKKFFDFEDSYKTTQATDQEMTMITVNFQGNEKSVYQYANDGPKELTEIRESIKTLVLTDNVSLKQQISFGVYPYDVRCETGFELILRPDFSPACVKPTSSIKLIERGWIECMFFSSDLEQFVPCNYLRVNN